MIDKLGGTIVGFEFLIELKALDGRAKLPGVDVKTFIAY
jgi:adenine phosphoribosyltransferase